jgi:hypothetical protein
MSEQLIVYEAQAAVSVPHGKNYIVNTGCANPVTLKRDVDFGVIPKTKKPSLYKSGAEKIALGYGMFQHYEIESKVEDWNTEAPFFYYCVKCSLVKLFDGREYVFTTGYGSSNTNEKRNGFNSAWDAANGTLKMAQKRALVSAALSISGLSDQFSQDMENEDFMTGAKALIDTDNPDSPVSTQQIRRLYAIGTENGLNAKEVKDKLAVMGFTSTKQITQKDYNRVCDALQGKEAE